MSDLRPRGIPIVLNGTERHLLFTLNVIDAIQSEYSSTVAEVINKAFNGTEEEQTQVVRTLISILLTDEFEREKFYNPSTELLPVSQKEAGWLVDLENLLSVKISIAKAYGISVPENDESDPNQTSEQQN